MNCIQENLTGFITKESCHYVIKAECISPIEFFIFIVFLIIIGYFVGLVIHYKGENGNDNKKNYQKDN